MIAPSNYSEWVNLLNQLQDRTDDREVLEAMKQGTLPWQSGVSERFVKKLINTVNCRMNAASDKFQRDLNNAHGSEGAVIQALLALRREMIFLTEAINLPVIPEGDREQYVLLVRAQADNMQKSLEDSAKKDRSGKMSSIIRNHRVNTY